MSEPSTSSQAALTADTQSPQEPKTFRMSLVSSARAKQPRIIDCEAEEIVELIRDGSGEVRAKIERIRKEFWRVMATNGDRKAAKKAIHEVKLSLPAVMPSGTFTRRDDEALSQHSGIICI